jgi:deoxyribonuclease-4
LFASGHDITESDSKLRSILDDFERAADSPPAFFHLNDSEGGLGSNKDRHVLIGEGRIGKDPFGWLLRDRRALGVPLILETPQQRCDISDEDPSADPYDLAMVTLLRALA